MVSSGTLVSPAEDPSRQKLWDETWKRVDRFLPDLRADITGPEPDVKGDTKVDTQVAEKAEAPKEVEIPERPKEAAEDASEEKAEAAGERESEEVQEKRPADQSTDTED